MADIQTLAQRAHRQLGAARLIGAVVDEVTIERQRNARGLTDRALERGIPAGVPARIKVGETVLRLSVIRRITQQMFHAEIDTAATTEHSVANRAVHRIRIPFSILLSERDADLHRP